LIFYFSLVYPQAIGIGKIAAWPDRCDLVAWGQVLIFYFSLVYPQAIGKIAAWPDRCDLGCPGASIT